MNCLRTSALVALSLAALAAPIATAQRAGEASGMIDMKSGRFASVFTSVTRTPDTLAAPVERVFAAMPAAFAALPVPLTVVDTSSKVMGALRVTVRRPIGGQRLSLLLECGTGNYGPNVERYTVQLTMLTRVTAIDATHTALETRVDGLATPNGLSSNVNCSSTGRLEEALLDLLKKQLGS